MEQINAGSSPHTRGTHGLKAGITTPFRIIPAYAGNTPIHSSSRLQSRDHPRIRGEHYIVADPVITYKGSSPHTRGTQSYQHGIGCGKGIIPAYAGNTKVWKLCYVPF